MDKEYKFSNGWTAKREYGVTPNGNCFGGRWVLRNRSGKLVDFDRYRNDLFPRHNLPVI